MSSVSRVVVLLLSGVVLTACHDLPSDPEFLGAPRAIIDIAVTPDPTLVTFNSASCAVTNSALGAVSCSWNIGNPAQNSLNFWAQAILTATYNCVNPHNGRIASTEQREFETLRQEFGVSTPTLAGSNVALPLTFLPRDLTGRMKKENACKGNGVVVALSYELEYWDVSVITTSGTQRFSCFASDDRLGCLT
jgi:hypothetical protein